jgi:NhaP-type Na+/H+ or K+/H+ antiporter
MSTVNLGLLVIGALVLGIGIFSRWIRRQPLSAPLVAFAIGIILGPYLAGVFDVATWGDEFYILEEAARFTLAIGLMGTALSLPSKDVLHRRPALPVLLGLINPIMWAIGALLAFGILGVAPLVALLVGACLAPTDPILARTIAEGETASRNIPPRMRYTILEESGFNDGLGFPFVLLGVYLLATPTFGQAFVRWTLYAVLVSVGGAFALGIALGYGAGRALVWSQSRNLIGRGFLLAYPIALALFSLALGRLLQVDGILVVFITGLAFVASGGGCESRAELQEIQATVDNFFSLPVFFIFGLTIPWGQWIALGWSALLFVLAVLALRRLPPILLLHPLLRPQIRDRREAAFVGRQPGHRQLDPGARRQRQPADRGLWAERTKGLAARVCAP